MVRDTFSKGEDGVDLHVAKAIYSYRSDFQGNVLCVVLQPTNCCPSWSDQMVDEPLRSVEVRAVM